MDLDRRGFLLVGIAAGLSGASDGSTGLISLVGYNDMAEMLTALDKAFVRRHPRVKVMADLPGTRFGPEALASGKATLAPMGARFTPQQTAAYRAGTGAEPIGFRVAHASLSAKALSGPNAIFVHRSNPLRSIDLGLAARLFATSGPHSWAETAATGSLRRQQMHLAGLAPTTPLALEFREAVFPTSDFTDGYRAFGQSREVIAFIGEEPAAIGFAALNRATDRVRALAISRNARSEPVYPTSESLRAGLYPLDRHLWIYARRDPSGRVAILARTYLEFALSKDGQAIIGSGTLGYLPLGEKERRAELARLIK